ncbi:hypothetical protein AgCh_038495 [Apium graveolens]
MVVISGSMLNVPKFLASYSRSHRIQECGNQKSVIESFARGGMEVKIQERASLQQTEGLKILKLIKSTMVKNEENINDMSSELYNFHVNLKSPKKENARIENVNSLLFERNNLLDTQLLDYENSKKDCLAAKNNLLRILMRK